MIFVFLEQDDIYISEINTTTYIMFFIDVDLAFFHIPHFCVPDNLIIFVLLGRKDYIYYRLPVTNLLLMYHHHHLPRRYYYGEDYY